MRNRGLVLLDLADANFRAVPLACLSLTAFVKALGAIKALSLHRSATFPIVH